MKGVRVTARRTERLRCAVCHGEAAAGELSRCAGCATLCHADCAALVQGCPSLACVRSPRSRLVPTLVGRPTLQAELDAFERALEVRRTRTGRTLRAWVADGLREVVLLRDPLRSLQLAGLVAGGLVCLHLAGCIAWMLAAS